MDENLEEQLSAGPEPEPQQEPPEEGQTERDTTAGLDTYLNIRVLVSMMAVFVLLFTFVARIIVVSGESMEDTLFPGDLILVLSLGYTPKQWDIVVLTQESYQEDSIVKRVIATGGQTVKIHYAVDRHDTTTRPRPMTHRVSTMPMSG